MEEPVPALEQRLKECREGEAQAALLVNLSYLEGGLPHDFVPLVLRVNPHVTELDLSSNQLSCLPDNLSDLKELRVLRCKYNALQGLPSVLASLPRLSVLELAGNQIGDLDASVLQHLTSLRDLDLSGNGLRTLPEVVATLPRLERLRLGNNALEHLPAEVGSCPALVRLDVSSNRLLDLPASLTQLQKIQRIDAKSNFLTRVPPCLGHLRALKEFDLRYNRLAKNYHQATEKGLARFLSFLRDEEEIERLADIDRNKPVGLQVGPCMVYKCRAVTEELLPSLGTASEEEYPWVRSGHALCVAGKTTFMFGGSVLKDDGRKTADLFWVCRDRMEWRLQPTKGDKPCPRDGHCMVYDPVRERLVVFGGRRQNKRRLNDIYFLDLVTWTWYQPRTDGEVPSPRDQCSALYHDNKIFIFGGRSQTSRLNELHVLDLDAWCWLVPEAHGTVPSPRQGAALAVLDDKLWLHGGTSNFVLDDTFTFDIDSGEWATAPTSGVEVPARHGHAMVPFEGSLFIYGGTDALGAAAPNMYKLKSATPNRYEWVKTEVALPANKYPSFIFGDDKLIVAQVGHPALKMKVPPMDMAAGRAVLDVVQVVELKDVLEKEAQPEDLIPKNPKLERILHCLTKADAGAKKLPASFTSHSNREQQVIQYISEFVDRWMQQHPVPYEPPLVLKNEWGTEKVVCSTLRPTCLPQTELHDLGGIVQFVSEYVHFEPLEKPSQPPAHLVSPASVLEWQAGDAFDLATLACSLLLGAGYNACVTIGFAAKHIALNDQTLQECPHLAAAGISQQPPAVNDEASSDNAGLEAIPPGGRSAGAVPGGRRSRGAGLVRISEGEEGKSQLLSRPATARSGEEGQSAAPAVASKDRNAAKTGPGEEVTPQGGGDTVQLAGNVSLQPAAELEIDKQTAAAQPSVQTATGEETTGAASQEPGNMASSAAECPGQPEEGNAEPGSSGATADPATQEGGATKEPERPEQPGPLVPPRYLHAFVLVRPGAREVSQPMFIDPATGLHFSPDELPCEGIAFAWNQNNIWANLQCSDERLTLPGDTDCNFGNPNAWEPVLHTAVDMSDTHSVSTEFSGVSSFLRATQSLPSSSALDWHQQSNSKTFTPRGAAVVMAPGVQRSQHKAVQAQAASRVTASPRLANHLIHGLEAGGSSVSYLAPSSGPDEPNSSPGIQSRLGRLPGLTPGGSEMPATWVPPLVLSQEKLDLRCPKGLKRTMYRQCQREIMARFGECARWDGLVERYTLFEDAECTVVECIVELFERRKDRLERRETYPASRLVKDSFGLGATAGLKQSAIVKGERRELSFYAETRADGLLRRVEVLGISLEEFYLGRPDRLLSRKIKYGTPDVALLGPPGPSLTRRGSLMAIKRDLSGLGGIGDAGRKSVMLSGSNTITYPFEKITEKFARDPSLPCDMDVAKRSFDLAQDMTFKVTCHYGEDEEGIGRLTRAVRVYGEKGKILENTGAATPPSGDWCKLEHLKLLAARKAAEVAGHAAEDESSEIVLARMRQEQNVQLITGHYDAPRNKVEDTDDEPEGDEEAADYLGPFLPAITGTRGLTAEEAAQVYRKCVQALRDRATERAAVMAARRSAEAADIKRLEGTELQQLSYSEQQRVKDQLADAKFRASVLERRMQEFQAVLAEKQSQLESKLRADQRLLPAVKARLV